MKISKLNFTGDKPGVWTLHSQRLIPIVRISCPRTLPHGFVVTAGHFPAPIAVMLIVLGADGGNGIS